MSNKLTNILAAILLTTMFLLAVFSIKDDTFTFDETSHVASGYSYLTQQDYRMNPEHPPLVKDLAAVPLLFLNLNHFLKSLKMIVYMFMIMILL